MEIGDRPRTSSEVDDQGITYIDNVASEIHLGVAQYIGTAGNVIGPGDQNVASSVVAPKSDSSGPLNAGCAFQTVIPDELQGSPPGHAE